MPGRTRRPRGTATVSAEAAPLLSVVVVAYDMPRQALNTLYSLSTDYQRDVSADDYEVLVLENVSDNLMDPEAVAALNGNFHYRLRQETRPTPVYAINEGLQAARGEYVCLMVDGARLLSPRVLALTLAAVRMNPAALVAVPGYHIGEHDHQHSATVQYDETVEAALLEEINWRDNGYRLFDISLFSGANPHGYFHPLLESNCMTAARHRLLGYGGANEGFQAPGGGAVNLDLYRGLALQPDTQLFVTPGEGSFHQYHGGVTTTEREDREQVLTQFRQEFQAVRGEAYAAARRAPTLIGPVNRHALPFLQASIEGGQKRYRRFRHEGNNPWSDDP